MGHPIDGATLDDWLAGDLPADEAAAVAAAVAADPALARRAEALRRRRALLDAGPPPPLPDLAADLLPRARWERTAPERRQAWWNHLAALTAAAGLLVGVGLTWLALASIGPEATGGQPFATAYAESGTPLAELVRQGRLDPRPAAPAPEGTAAPGLGVWIQPVQLELPDLPRRGHLVLRVEPGSSAERAGIQAGDVLLSVDGWPTCTPTCIVHALRGHHPGDVVPVEFYAVADRRQHRTEVAVGARRD